MEYQQAESFEGAQLLGALALASTLGSKGAMGNSVKTDMPTDKETLIKLMDAAEVEANKTGQPFDRKQQLRSRVIGEGDPGHPGYMHRFFESEGSPGGPHPRMFRISYDKAADRAIAAHELGHVVAQNNDVGLRINQLANALRNNPKLQDFLDTAGKQMPEGVTSVVKPYLNNKKLLAMGRVALPTAIAAAIPGDDDAAAVLAANLLISSPELVDEAIASKNALSIMKQAGMPATGRQKLRMAGAWGSYLAKPLTAALIGNMAGNVIEDMA